MTKDIITNEIKKLYTNESAMLTVKELTDVQNKGINFTTATATEITYLIGMLHTQKILLMEAFESIVNMKLNTVFELFGTKGNQELDNKISILANELSSKEEKLKLGSEKIESTLMVFDDKAVVIPYLLLSLSIEKDICISYIDGLGSMEILSRDSIFSDDNFADNTDNAISAYAKELTYWLMKEGLQAKPS